MLPLDNDGHWWRVLLLAVQRHWLLTLRFTAKSKKPFPVPATVGVQRLFIATDRLKCGPDHTWAVVWPMFLVGPLRLFDCLP